LAVRVLLLLLLAEDLAEHLLRGLRGRERRDHGRGGDAADD
jgi:hypothetical protein